MALHPWVRCASAITVSSRKLQRRYGGVILRHGPDETVFDPARAPEARLTRVRLELPLDPPSPRPVRRNAATPQRPRPFCEMHWADRTRRPGIWCWPVRPIQRSSNPAPPRWVSAVIVRVSCRSPTCRRCWRRRMRCRSLSGVSRSPKASSQSRHWRRWPWRRCARRGTTSGAQSHHRPVCSSAPPPDGRVCGPGRQSPPWAHRHRAPQECRDGWRARPRRSAPRRRARSAVATSLHRIRQGLAVIRNRDHEGHQGHPPSADSAPRMVQALPSALLDYPRVACRNSSEMLTIVMWFETDAGPAQIGEKPNVHPAILSAQRRGRPTCWP